MHLETSFCNVLKRVILHSFKNQVCEVWAQQQWGGSTVNQWLACFLTRGLLLKFFSHLGLLAAIPQQSGWLATLLVHPVALTKTVMNMVVPGQHWHRCSQQQRQGLNFNHHHHKMIIWKFTQHFDASASI